MKAIEELASAERYSRIKDFATIVSLILKSLGILTDALFVAARGAASPRAQRILKAAVSAGTMENMGDLADLGVVSAGFIESLRTIGAFDRMAGDMMRVPMDTPWIRLVTTGATGYLVAEGQSKPITRINLGSEALDKFKVDAILVLSDTLANSASAAATTLLTRELRAAVAAATDGTVIAALALAGPPPVPATGGATAADVRTDIAAALGAMAPAAAARVYVIVSPPVLWRLRLLSDTAGGLAFANDEMGDRLTFVGGDAVATELPPAAALVVDASGCAADPGVVSLDAASHAALEMDSAPSGTAGGVGSPDAPTHAELMSLWQTNSRAIRASRRFGFRVIRPEAVQTLIGIGW